MIFGLGFCTAAVLGLLAAPLVARLAERRARLGLEQRLPMSLDEVAAARDQLAASYAVALRVAEHRAEAGSDKLASAMADAGRQLARAVAADERAAEASAKASTLAAALATAEQEAAIVQNTLLARTAELEQATTVAEDRATALLGANERVAGVEAMIADQRTLLDELGLRLAERVVPAQVEDASADDLPIQDAPSEAASVVDAPIDDPQAVATRLRQEAATLRRADTLGAAERDRLKLRVDELLLRVAELEEETGEASERAEADRREAARQAKLAASLSKKLGTRDDTIKALKRQAATVIEGRLAMPTTKAGFREAIAKLAAELVTFAEKEARDPDKAGQR